MSMSWKRPYSTPSLRSGCIGVHPPCDLPPWLRHMSWSSVGRAALERLCGHGPHLRISTVLGSYDLNVDGRETGIRSPLIAPIQIRLAPHFAELLTTYPEWQVLLRIAVGSSPTSLRFGAEGLDLQGSLPPLILAAILEASPVSAPHFRVGNSEHLAAEMVAHMRSTRASDDATSVVSLGRTFVDAWWEVTLEDPRAGFDEALPLEEVLVALEVGGCEARVTLRCFNMAVRGEPHPLSNAPLIDRDYPAGFHLIRQHVGHRARYLRLAVHGEVTLLGVEAYCMDLWQVPCLHHSLRAAAKIFAAQPAIAMKVDGQSFSYQTLSNDVEALSVQLRQRFPLDAAIEHGEDVMLGWCGPTRVEALLLFLACMMNQWCFVAFHRHSLAAELQLLPKLQLLGVDEAFEAEEIKVLENAHQDAAGRGVLFSSPPLLRPAELQSMARMHQPDTVSSTAPAAASPERLGNLIFTSGSTGHPKAVRRSHAELYAFLWLYAKAVTPDRALAPTR
ncbi:unnamed protein product [Durusdinium trenchii]|uniref:AMP-dependent synthetase/ligase domain-containing protein n=1 Tax=Durusdinium trenchii TaxID=1381693 RepID=A0ABP0IFJ3_9DINO